MFEEEREEYTKFFDFFKTMFKEDVALMPSIYEDDEFEIDLVIGEDSGEIRGIRVLQMISSNEEEEEDIEWEGSAKEILESSEEETYKDETAEEEEDEEEEDENEEDDDEEEGIEEMYQYDFVATDYEPSKIVGNLCLETTFDMPNHVFEENDEEEEDETEEEDQKSESEESESQVKEHNGEWYHLRLYGVKGETEEAEIDITCALLENGDHPEKKYLFLPHPQLD